jgi:5,10-methylenetetrahydromethanopterin reductase
VKLARTFYSVLKMPIDDIVACSVSAEDSGFSHICVAESFYRDGFALASAIASHTKKVKFGTSVMPIYTRTPFELAMGITTLNELSHGRVAFLGLGVGYNARTEQFFGINQTERLARMREYVEIIRKLPCAEEVSYAARFFKMSKFPGLCAEPVNIPIYFGSTAPKMLRLAGEVSDGVILNSISTPDYVETARGWIGEGVSSAGRKPSEVEVAHSINLRSRC